MNKFKFEAFRQEFPFLTEILTRKNGYGVTPKLLQAEEITSIHVKRIDTNLLNAVPEKFSWDGSLGSTTRFTEFSLVAVVTDGHDVILNAVRQASESGSNYAHSETIYTAGETVLEAIDRTGSAELAYIVQYDREYDSWQGRETTDTREVTIYKVAREDNLLSLIEDARRRAQREVLTKADF